MKKQILIFATITSVFTAVAQEKTNNITKSDVASDSLTNKTKENTLVPIGQDTTKIEIDKNMQILLITNKKCKDDTCKWNRNKKEKNKHWAGLYLGVNGYISSSNTLQLPVQSDFMKLNYAKSIHFGLNFWEKDIHLYKDYAMLVTGMGFDFNTYALQNNITLHVNKDSVWAITDTLYKFSKNKLKTTFITVPLMLAFNTDTNSKKAFHLAAGIVLGYKISSKTKQRFNIDNEKINYKIYDNYNINPFRYDATVRIGYGNYNLYASYTLNSLFESGKGPELYPFTVGIKVIGL